MSRTSAGMSFRNISLLLAAAVLAPTAYGAKITKADNTTALGTAGSWTGGVAPSSSDIADWSGAYTIAGSLSAALPGSAITWDGISIGNISGSAAGLVSIGGTGAATASSTLSIGGSGIDMSVANQNLVINTTAFSVSASQTWTVASGRNLRFGTSGTGAANAKMVAGGSTSSTLITIAGGGVVDLNQGGTSGFSDVAGFSGYAGKWQVNSGTTLRGLRNGATAWGSNTAADAILLNGGTLANGGISGANGDWTWTTNIQLAAGTSSFIDQQAPSGTDRYLKLNGTLSSASGAATTLTFKETSNFSNIAKGFVITGTNTNLSGTVNIGTGTGNGVNVRVGGVSGNDTTLLAGTTGDLGVASVVISSGSTLNITRSNNATFSNNISGAGVLYIGSGQSTSTGVITLTGNNTYSGGNELFYGTLSVSNLADTGGAGSAGTGYVAVKAGARLTYTGGTVSTVRNLFLDNGAATINVTDANAVLTWTDTSLKGGATGALITKAGAGTLVLGGAIANGGTTAVAVSGGTLRLNGTNTYTGATTIASGATLDVSNTGVLAATTAIAVDGTLSISTSSSQVLSSAITGAGVVSKSGSGTLTLSATGNSFSGGTNLSAGTLALGASGVLADAGTVNVSGGTLNVSNFNETVGALTISGGTISGATGILTASAINASVASGTATLDALTAGSGILSKSGNGTLSLAKAAAHTGGTTVSAGTLSFASSNLLADAGTVTVSGGILALGANTETVGALTVSSGGITGNGTLTSDTSISVTNTTASGLVTIAANLAGTAALTKTGNGELTLSGVNAYTGGTSINEGVVSVTGSIGSASVAAAARLRGIGTVGALSLADGAIVEAGQLGVGSLSVGSITVDAAAVANLNIAGVANYGTNAAFSVGDITFGLGGTIQLNVTGAAGLGSFKLLTYTGSVSATDFTLNYAGLSSRSSAELDFTTSGLVQYVVSGDQPKWVGTSTGWSTTDNWRLVSAGTLTSFEASDALVFDDSASSGVVEVATDVDPSSMTFAGSTLDYTLASTGGTITSGSLAKTGAALLTVTGANTFAGGTTLSAGRIRVGSDSALGTGTITITGGSLSSDSTTARVLGNAVILAADSVLGDATDTGALTFSGNFALGGSVRTLTLASNVTLSGVISNGGLTKLGNGTLTLSGANDYSGGTTISAGSVALGASNVLADSGAVTIASGATLNLGGFSDTVGVVTLSGGTLSNGTLTAASVSASAGTISAALAGSGALTKTGNGTLTLSGASSYTGGTTLSAGTLAITSGTALGSAGTVTLNDASTDASATTLSINASAASVTLARAITVANQGSGVSTIGSSALSTGNQAIFSGAVTLARDVTLYGAGGGDRTQFSGGISGTGNVTISTAGNGRVLFITTANTFSGSLTVAANSVLQLSDGSAAATSYIPDAAVVTLQAGSELRMAKGGNSETVGGLSGSGTVSALSGSDTLLISNAADQTFSGVLRSNGGTLNLSKSGAGKQTLTGSNSTIYNGTTTVSAGILSFSNGVSLTGITRVDGGKLELNGATSVIGSALVGTSAGLGEVSFGANTLVIGNATNSNQFYYGKLTGTGTIQLRGGALTILNSDGTVAGTGANFEIWTASAAVIQSKSVQFFALDTGASLTDRKDFAFINDTSDALNLSALSGFGAIRNDAGGTSVRNVVVDQASDTVFSGALLSHRSGAGAVRALSLTKQGAGTLELAGFVGKSTASGQTGAAAVHLTVEAGVLNVTNAFNTTTTNTDAINLGVVTVTGGSLGFSAQALLNNAGTAGATRIDLNGGVLRWNTGNTQDLSAGGRLKINDGVVGQFNTNGNDVTLGTALALGAAKTGGLTKLGEGILTVGAANTYTGLTTVSAGTLKYGAAGAFGTSEVRVAGGTLDLNSLDLANTIVLTGGSLANYGAWTGALNVGYVVSGSDLDALAGTYGKSVVTLLSGGSVSVSGLSRHVILQGGSLTGNLSTFTGDLTVRSAVSFATASAGGRIQLENGGSIDYTGRTASDTIHYVAGSLTNAGGFTGDVAIVGTGVSLTAGNFGAGRVVVDADSSVSIGTGFSNNIRLTGGTLVGDTLNHLTGTVTVANSSTLDLDGAASTAVISNASASIVLESGSTLAGSGAVGAVVVQAGGILAPGNSPGLIEATSMQLNAGMMNFEVAGLVDVFGSTPLAGVDYDTVTVTGELDLSNLSTSSRFVLNLISIAESGLNPAPVGWDPSLGFELTLFSYGTLDLGDNISVTSIFTINSDNFFDSLGAPVDLAHFSVRNDTELNQIRLVYSTVPEPSTYGMLLGGLALVAAVYRRKRLKTKV